MTGAPITVAFRALVAICSAQPDPAVIFQVVRCKTATSTVGTTPPVDPTMFDLCAGGKQAADKIAASKVDA